MKPHLFTTCNPNPIAADKNILVSIVPTRIPIIINGTESIINSFIIAISKNKCKTWFYIEGTKTEQSLLKQISEDLFNLCNFPKKTLNINDQIIDFE